MRIQIIAVGKQVNTPYAEIIAEYNKRLQWSMQLKEIITSAQQLECAAIGKVLPNPGTIIAMTPGGQLLSSEAWAKHLEQWQSQQQIHFVLGGADGLNAEILARAALQISFGPAIWPHLLARVMLYEQLYRAQCILKNHPYHRG